MLVVFMAFVAVIQTVRCTRENMFGPATSLVFGLHVSVLSVVVHARGLVGVQLALEALACAGTVKDSFTLSTFRCKHCVYLVEVNG